MEFLAKVGIFRVYTSPLPWPDAKIEFYDSRFAGSTLDPLKNRGQFVSRYYVDTFKSIKHFEGLCLDTGSKDWALTAEEVAAVQAALVKAGF